MLAETITPFEAAAVNARYFVSSFTFLASLNELATRMEECNAVLSGSIDLPDDVYQQALRDKAEVEILFSITQAAIFDIAAEA
jgi:hypothetical protein